jgi:STE24 endopeptidase
VALDATIQNVDWLLLVVAVVTLAFSWEFYLKYRQHIKLLEPKLPLALKLIVKPDEFKKARLYGLDKSYYAFVSDLYGQMVLYWTLFSGLKMMWDHSLLVSNYLQIQGEIYQQIIFGAIFGLFNLILNLPFSLYYNFVLEEKHGFNKQTVALYFADLVKTIFFGWRHWRTDSGLFPVDYSMGWQVILFLHLGFYLRILSLHQHYISYIDTTNVQYI